MEKYHILIVDDDDRLRKLLEKYLTENDFMTTTASCANDAKILMEAFSFDLIVMDVMMPGETGIELTQVIRKDSQVPILMLTAMGETQDRILGLEAGVDDYMPKPFEPRELVLRINSILKRIPKVQKDELESLNLGTCIYNIRKNELLRDDVRIHLTPAEVTLLKTLAEKPGEVFSREDLGIKMNTGENLRTIDVQVTRLRKKIEPDTKIPRYLQTIRGKGYMLLPD
jgi:two-component system phosphate regulon response regulator OmpR